MGNEKYVAYVGSYTRDTDKGIHVYDVDMGNGLLIPRQEVVVSNASYVAKAKSGKFLYSIEDEGVAVFSIDQKTGDLTRINSVSINGMRGCFLSTDVTGKYLYVAGYHDGKLTVVHTHRDGRLGSIMDGVFHRGIGSVAERNFRPHINCVRPTPDNKYICAVDNGIDQIKIYSINNRTNKLRLEDILRCKRESGPKMIRFSADGKFAYVLFELSNEINVYSYDGSNTHPEFEYLQTVSTLSGNVDRVHDAACSMALAPDGKHLFCTTAGDDTVAMFEVDDDGLLKKKFALPVSGEYPKDLAVFPDCKHLAIANHDSGTITTFTVDYEKNVIVQKGKPIKVDAPNCITFFKVEGE